MKHKYRFLLLLIGLSAPLFFQSWAHAYRGSAFSGYSHGPGYPYRATINASELESVASFEHLVGSPSSVYETWLQAQQREIDEALASLPPRTETGLLELFNEDFFQLSQHGCGYVKGDDAVISNQGSRYAPILTIPCPIVFMTYSAKSIGENIKAFWQELGHTVFGQTPGPIAYDYEVLVIPSNVLFRYLVQLEERLKTTRAIKKFVDAEDYDLKRKKIVVQGTPRNRAGGDLVVWGEPYTILLGYGTAAYFLDDLDQTDRKSYLFLWKTLLEKFHASKKMDSDQVVSVKVDRFIDRFYLDASLSLPSRLAFFETRLFPLQDELFASSTSSIANMDRVKMASAMTARNLCKFFAVAEKLDLPVLLNDVHTEALAIEVQSLVDQIQEFNWCGTNEIDMVTTNTTF